MTRPIDRPHDTGCVIASVVQGLPAGPPRNTVIRVRCCAAASGDAADAEPNTAPIAALTDGAVSALGERRAEIFVAPMPLPEVLDARNAQRIALASDATASARRAIVESGGLIRANVLLVGPIDRAVDKIAPALCATDQSVGTRSMALRRWVTYDQLKQALLWLAFESPEFMSGAVVPLDGGMNMGRYT